MSDWVEEILGTKYVPTFHERVGMVYEYVCSFCAEHPYGPTVREIQSAVPASTSTIHKILKQLRDEKRVTWEEKLARTLRPVNA